MAVKVKVKLNGKHAADYLSNLPAPGDGSPAPQIKIQSGGKKKKRPMPSRQRIQP